MKLIVIRIKRENKLRLPTFSISESTICLNITKKCTGYANLGSPF